MFLKHLACFFLLLFCLDAYAFLDKTNLIILKRDANFGLTDLNNVTITAPILNNCLKFNGSIWVNNFCGGGGDVNLIWSSDANRLSYWLDANTLIASGVSQETTLPSNYADNIFGFNSPSDTKPLISIYPDITNSKSQILFNAYLPIASTELLTRLSGTAYKIEGSDASLKIYGFSNDGEGAGPDNTITWDDLLSVGAITQTIEFPYGKLVFGGDTFTFPSSDGTANQFLKTDGAGTLSFGSATDTNTVTAGWTNADGNWLIDLNVSPSSKINAEWIKLPNTGELGFSGLTSELTNDLGWLSFYGTPYYGNVMFADIYGTGATVTDDFNFSDENTTLRVLNPTGTVGKVWTRDLNAYETRSYYWTDRDSGTSMSYDDTSTTWNFNFDKDTYLQAAKIILPNALLFSGNTSELTNDAGFSIGGGADGNLYSLGILSRDNNQFLISVVTQVNKDLNSYGGINANTIRSFDNNNLSFQTLNETRMNILSDGNVGIGVSTPVNKLNVLGDLNTIGYVGISDGNLNFYKTPAPVTAPNADLNTTAGNITGTNFKYVITYITRFGETISSPVSNTVATATSQRIDLNAIPISPNPEVFARNIYRTSTAQISFYYVLIGRINNNTTTTYQDNTTEPGLAVNPVNSFNTAGGNIKGLSELKVGVSASDPGQLILYSPTAGAQRGQSIWTYYGNNYVGAKYNVNTGPGYELFSSGNNQLRLASPNNGTTYIEFVGAGIRGQMGYDGYGDLYFGGTGTGPRNTYFYNTTRTTKIGINKNTVPTATLDVNGDMNINNNGTSLLVVRTDGNVGIGTASPTNKLNVIGDINMFSSGYQTVIKKDGNLLMKSPNGTTYNCGVTDGGVFQCT